MGHLTYEVEVGSQVHSTHVDHFKAWPVESSPSSKPLSDDIHILSQTPQSDNNDNSITAAFLALATDVIDENSDEQTHSTN